MKGFASQKTKTKIVRTALRLFVRRGYHGTSIASISAAANLTKGAIYFHFKNKDALLKRILEEFDQMFLQKAIEEVAKVSGGGLDKLHHFLRFASNYAAKNSDVCLCLTALSTELCGSTSKKQEKWIKEVYSRYHQFIAELLEEGKEYGSFREDLDPHIAAMILVGANDGNLLQWNANRNEIDGEVYARSLLKFLLSGICKQKYRISPTHGGARRKRSPERHRLRLDPG
jgi:AcrR family transcriptional regulator